MSFIGKQPSVDSLKLVPLSADPTTPYEGMIFYSDGTSRLEGPWVYQNGVWAQFSTGAAITTVNSLTLTPQSADPGTPTEGMLFYADGTSRDEGVWVYSNSGWNQVTGVKYKEFFHKPFFFVRAASTANVILASQVENGDSFGGVTLATNDLVLLKDQTTASENGVYVVQASGAPVRSTSYDTVAELNNAAIVVSAGTNVGNRYWQTATLSSLSDNQVWATSPNSFTFTVPSNVYEIEYEIVGGGGAGGAGGGGTPGGGATAGGGGAGGAGATPNSGRFKVAPGTVLTVSPGIGGRYGIPAVGTGGGAGTAGTASSVQGTGVSLSFPGTNGGAGGGGPGGAGGVAGSAYNISGTFIGVFNAGAGGNGGASSNTGANGSPGLSANISPWASSSPAVGTGGASSGITGAGGGGGAGGPGLGAGGAGGNGGAGNSPPNHTPGADASNYGSGGGGGGGAGGNNTGAGSRGGMGASGYVRLSWA